MRIVALSDTHMLHHMLVVPDGDVLVHSGDWGGETVSDYDDFFAWLAALPHRYKILTAGNHENLMQEFNKMMRRRIPTGITYLEDSGITIEGRRFWGSPRTASYPWMAFTHQEGDQPERIWAKIPDALDVLITHGPPAGILDRNYAGQHVGDQAMLERIHDVRPKLHLFGHVHDSNGRIEHNGTIFVNAAVGDDDEADLSSLIHVIDL